MLIQRLSIAATVVTLCLIVLGAFVRLSDAGLGCPDWPTCYGHLLWPQDSTEITEANQDFAKTPVDINKAWPEQVHRLLASSLGVFSLVLFGMAFRAHRNRIKHIPQSSAQDGQVNEKRIHSERIKVGDLNKAHVNKAEAIFALLSVIVAVLLLIARIILAQFWVIDDKPVYDAFDPAIGIAIFSLLLFSSIKLVQTNNKTLLLSALTVIAIILQGLFGMWTVTLKLWPQVVSIHLLGGMFIACLFYGLALFEEEKNRRRELIENTAAARKLHWLSLTMLLSVLCQILLGGWVSSNYAAVACADFPTCQGQWWPDANFAKGFNLYQSIGPNYLGGILHSEARAAIHFTHRLGALAVTIIGVFFYFNLFKSSETKSLAKIGFSLLSIQMLLGISNVLFQFPMTIALLHTLFAGILLLHSLHCVVRFTLPINANLKHPLDKGQIA